MGANLWSMTRGEVQDASYLYYVFVPQVRKSIPNDRQWEARPDGHRPSRAWGYRIPAITPALNVRSLRHLPALRPPRLRWLASFRLARLAGASIAGPFLQAAVVRPRATARGPRPVCVPAGSRGGAEVRINCPCSSNSWISTRPTGGSVVWCVPRRGFGYTSRAKRLRPGSVHARCSTGSRWGPRA